MLYWLALILLGLAAGLIFRVAIRRDYLVRGKLSVFSTSLEFLIFALHANLPYLYLATSWPGLPPLPECPLQQVAGMTLASIGFLATLVIMAYLGFGISVGDHPGQLRQTGPYSWSRNPQLLSYGLLLLGCLVLYPSWESAAWLALYGLIAHLMAVTEEEHLRKQFGSRYDLYCQRVPRYLSFPGKKGILPQGPK